MDIQEFLKSIEKLERFEERGGGRIIRKIDLTLEQDQAYVRVCIKRQFNLSK